MDNITDGKKLVYVRKHKKPHTFLPFTSHMEMLQAHLYNL